MIPLLGIDNVTSPVVPPPVSPLPAVTEVISPLPVPPVELMVIDGVSSQNQGMDNS